jgi:hypothetical protein
MTQTNLKADVHSKIDSLLVSPKLKEKFHFICDNFKKQHLINVDYGLRGISTFKMMNIFAFLCSSIYYWVFDV